ncbi:MAG: hypothetical protein K8J08_10485, partial [Thermoanaerobaculia bacterium]|nr:hypothetical protein [Thermoanaerobaculia bacterium]
MRIRCRFALSPRHLLASLLFVTAASTLAAPPREFETTPLFERFSEREGLPDSTVYALSQDEVGLLWIATGAGGLNVFDGQRFRTAQRGAGTASTPYDSISTVLVSRQGWLWIGAWGGGLEVYDPVADRSRKIGDASGPQRIQSLLEGRDGTLWVGSSGEGLFRLDAGSEELVSVLDGTRVEGHGRIWSLAEDSAGLWVATSADLVYIPFDDNEEMEFIGLPIHPRALLLDGDTLWIGGDDQLYRLDRRTRSGIERVAGGLTVVNVLYRLEDRLLVGTESGLRAIDPVDGSAAWPLAGQPELVVSDDNIRDILQDRSGLLWLATREGGLLKLRSDAPAFGGGLLPGSLRTVIAISEVASDRVLLGTRRGLWKVERRNENVVVEPVEGADSLFVAVLQAREGGAWIGTPEGLMVYDGASGRIEPSPFAAALPKGSISALCEDSRGRLWISYWDEGLVRFDPNSGVVLTLNTESTPALPHNQILALAAEDEILWINGTHDGLVRIDVGRNQVEQFSSGEGGIPRGLVRAIHAGPGQDLWFASNFGIVRMDRDSGVVTPVSVGRDRPTARVSSIVADREGNIWIATTQGLVRIGALRQDVVWFTEADGLATSQLVWNAAAIGKSGRLHFGGVGGFVSFDPAAVGSGQPPPEVSIVQVTVDGVGSSPQGTLTLQPEQRELTLRYAALDFRRPELNRFQYGLEGLD